MIKFTPFGVPYVLEFDHVAFDPLPADDLDESFCYIETPPPSPRPSFSLTTLFRRKTSPPANVFTKPLPPLPSPALDGIHIQFSSEHSHPHRRTRKQRLIHLQQTISNAVLDAGMSRSPENTSQPENSSPLPPPRGHRSSDALFCGTYGQLMAALEGAGLSASPCASEGLSGYTRLGALFVARNNGPSGVQVRKITLWG